MSKSTAVAAQVAAFLARAAEALRSSYMVEAEALLVQARQLDPKRTEVLVTLGMIHISAGRPAEALPLLRRAVSLRPALAVAHGNLGLALSALGQHREAVTSLTRAVRLAPGDAQLHYNLGTVLHASGDASGARIEFAAAIAIDPAFTEALFNLGNLLREAGAVDEAERAYRTVLGLRADDLPARLNLAGLLLSASRFAEALECCEQVLASAPGLAIAQNGRANALHGLERFDEALEAFTRAAALDLDSAQIRYNLANQQLRLGLTEPAIESFRRTLALDPTHAQAAQNLLLALNYADRATGDEIAGACRHWAPVAVPAAAPAALTAAGQRFRAGVTGAPGETVQPRLSGSRLRLGFVSADLRLHSVASFLLPLLESLDPGRFEVFCYANQSIQDGMTQRLQAASSVWRDILPLDDRAAARMIAEDAIDLLVDLSGYTAGHRLGVFAYRPAPVQVSWLGYPASTGQPFIDARIVDAITDPADPSDAIEPAHRAPDTRGSERLLRLDRCFVCYQPSADLTEAIQAVVVRDPRAPLVFGSFNNLAKLSESTIALWSAALVAVPGSRLVLKAAGTEQAGVRIRLLAAFASHGVLPERLRFLPRAPTLAAHLACYADVDIALDSYPYHGTTTSCEALTMGVPVVSLIGDRHASRVGASLLAAAGTPQWAVDTHAAFAGRVAELAEDIRSGRFVRSALQQQIKASSLCDAGAFARAFTQAVIKLA